MPIFFESRARTSPARKALRDALAREPPVAAQLDVEADALATALSREEGGGMRPRPGSFIIAAGLLAALAGLAVWAEQHQMKEATGQLWTAFQTILGVIVGFLGGEASGAATGQQAP